MSSSKAAVNILVVEDEWLIAMDLALQIEERGHVVLGPVQDVSAALELIDRQSVDAAFLDVNLGHETSFPVAQRLLDMEVPVTFVTARGRCDIPNCFDCFDLLPKPAGRRQLMHHLDRMAEAAATPS